MLIYVDDIILTRNNPSFLSSLVSRLGTEFAIKDLGALHFFLRIEVHKIPNGYHIIQQKYTRDLLAKEKMMDSSALSTFMSTNQHKCPHDNECVDPTTYCSLVGSLQYLTLTRSNIAYSVNKACQHMQQPQMQHLKEAKRIIRYLKRTMKYGITFFKNNSLNLYAFCDADWAGCPTTRRSTS